MAQPKTDTAGAIAKLRRAIYDKGPVPQYHDAVMRRHRREWPTLWEAIDELLWKEDDELRRPAPGETYGQ